MELRRQTFLILPLTSSVLLGVVLKHVFVVNSTIQDGQILNLGLLIGREATSATSATSNLPETSDLALPQAKRNQGGTEVKK